VSARCAWPIGDPRDPDFNFCGRPVARPGLPYCAAHMARAYRKASVHPRLQKSALSGTQLNRAGAARRLGLT
jgi:GcrA cell cycle regulator